MKAKLVRDFLYEYSREENIMADEEIEKWEKETGKIKPKSFEQTLFTFLDPEQIELYTSTEDDYSTVADISDQDQGDIPQYIKTFIKENPEVMEYVLFDQYVFSSIGLGDREEWYGDTEPKMLNSFDFKKIHNNFYYDNRSKVSVWKQVSKIKQDGGELYYWLWFYKPDDLSIPRYQLSGNYNQLLLKGAEENNIKDVKSALKNGANIDIEYGRPIIGAVWNGFDEMVNILLKYKPSKEYVYEALNAAAQTNQLKILKSLIDYGVKPRIETVRKATRGGSYEVLKYLVEEAGIPPDERCLETAVSQLPWEEDNKKIEKGTSYNIIKFLAERGANISNEIIEKAKTIGKKIDMRRIIQLLEKYKDILS